MNYQPGLDSAWTAELCSFALPGQPGARQRWGEGRKQERRRKGKILVCRGLCFSEKGERDGLSLSRPALPAGKFVSSEDFYF